MSEIPEEAVRAARYAVDDFPEDGGIIDSVVVADAVLEAAAPILAAHYRREGLEEAAQICDRMAGTEAHGGTLAEMIRALKEKPNG